MRYYPIKTNTFHITYTTENAQKPSLPPNDVSMADDPDSFEGPLLSAPQGDGTRVTF